MVNLGPNREHGHLAITVYYETKAKSCQAAASERMEEILFCDEASGASPFRFGIRNYAESYMVSAVHADTRAVMIAFAGTALDVMAMRTVIADPALVEALP